MANGLRWWGFTIGFDETSDVSAGGSLVAVTSGPFLRDFCDSGESVFQENHCPDPNQQARFRTPSSYSPHDSRGEP